MGRPKKTPRKPKRKYRINEAERLARTKRIEDARPVIIDLKNTHYRGGFAYGPGPTRVSGGLARDLTEADQRALQAERDFHGTKGAIIGPKRRGMHVIKEVPLETFGSDWAETSEEAVYVPKQTGGS